MGFEYPKFQKDYEESFRQKRKRKITVIKFVVLIILTVATLIYGTWNSVHQTNPTKNSRIIANPKTISNTVIESPPIPSTPTAKPKYSEEKVTPSVYKCTRDGKTVYIQMPCNSLK